MRKIRNIPDIGELDEKILFQRSAGVKDGATGERISWLDVVFSDTKSTKWAKYDNTPGHSWTPIAGHMEYFDRATFTVQDDNSEITQIPIKKLRIVYPATGGNRRVYKILGVNPVAGKKWFVSITCSGNQTEAV